MPEQMPPPMGAPPPMQSGGAPAGNAPPKGNAPSFPQPPQQDQGGADSTIEEIEQVVETIIDERWKEVTENIQKVLEWKNTMDEKFTKMQEDVNNLKEDFNELYRAIVGKVGEYDNNILKVDTELKALEKVFSQVLPNFTANVNELGRIAQDIRSAHPENNQIHNNTQPQHYATQEPPEKQIPKPRSMQDKDVEKEAEKKPEIPKED